jgi:hypothetical protein
MSDEPDPIGWLVEVLVFAPIGAGAYLRDNVPACVNSLVARGRTEVDRRRADVGRHVTTARSTGQVAVLFGVPVLRRRVQGALDRNRGVPASKPATVAASTDPGPDAAAPEAPEAPKATPPASYSSEAGADASDDGPRSDGLPIPGYDALSASQVVERLVGLGPDELDAVQAYESAHRQRRTILGKIEQLAG